MSYSDTGTFEESSVVLPENNSDIQGCDLPKVKHPEKWVAGLGPPLV